MSGDVSPYAAIFCRTFHENVIGLFMERPYIKIRRYPLCGASPATPRGFAVHKWTRHKMRLNQEKNSAN